MASLKARLYAALPELKIVDISHDITPFSISEGALVLTSCVTDFPPGTLHLAGVIGGAKPGLKYLIATAFGQTFIAPDNGLLSLVIGWEPVQYYLVNSLYKGTFPQKDVMVPLAISLLQGAEPQSLGEETQTVVTLIARRASFEGDTLRGAVTYVDSFGNCLTNITWEDFTRMGDYKSMRIYTGRREYIEKISFSYDEVNEGEKVATFNPKGFLEIAINKGSATLLLGLKEGSIIMLELLR